VRFRAALDQLPRGFYHRYATLAAKIMRSGQRPFGPPFAIFGKSDDNAVDVEAGLLIEEPMGPVGDIEVKRLPERLVVALTHGGPYEQIGASYFALLGWMDDRSLGRDGPFMEVYLDGPDTTHPRQTSTRIVVPVRAPARRDLGGAVP
jgi:effector-binding domain-containing protein